MHFSTALLMTLLLGFTQLSAQKLSYDINLFGKKIGQSDITRSDMGDGEIIYHFTSKSEAKVLFVNKSSATTAIIIFKNNQLQYAKYNIKTDEDGASENITTKQADGYTFSSKGTKSIIKKVIRYGSLSLYFEEPTTASEFYSERLGKFFTLTKIGPSEYKSQVNNVTSYYRYQNGKLIELEMSKSLGSVFMRLKS